jgi:ABC-type glycerol-3-phosphate transport system substrate-binding protein
MQMQSPEREKARGSARRAGVGRRTLLFAGVGAGAALSAACGGASGTPKDEGKYALAPGGITLVPFLSQITPDMMGGWDENIVATYRQKRSNVKIELVPQTGPTIDRIEKLRALTAAGSPPDLGDGPQGPQVMVPQGMLDPAMDALVKRDKYDTKKYNQAHFERGSVFEGKIWAMPYRYGGNVICLACNTDLFRAAGVAPPPGDVAKAWTWEQFVDALTRVTKREGGGQTAQFGLAGIGWIVGTWTPLWKTDWLDEPMKTVTCDNPEMRDCFGRIADLFHKHHVVPQLGEAARLFGNANLFNTAKAAVLPFPPTGWRTYGAGAQVDYALTPIPTVKTTTPDVGMGGISLYASGQHPADGWDFTKHLIEDSRYARLIGLMPAPVAEIEPWLKEQFKNVPSADPKVMVKIVESAGESGTRMSLHPKYAEMQAIINPAMDDLMAGTVAAVPMLQGLKAPLQGIIDGK